MVPPYERPAAPVAERYPGAQPAEAGAVAVPLWADFFADARLRQLIERALANNLDLRVAVLNVEETRAQFRISRAALFPNVQGAGHYVGSGNFDSSGEQWSASLGTTAWELDLFGRVRSLNRQALEKYFATDEARRGQQISLVAQVATEYYVLREAEELRALAQRTLAVVEESFRLNRATFEAGASNELDLRAAEGQVQAAQINVTAYARLQAQAEHALTVLLGTSLPEDLPDARPFTDPQALATIPAGLPSELLQRRPDIRQAEHILKAANANIGAARAAFFPTISLTASVGTQSSQLSQLFGAGTGVWSFAPQITVPIFAAGQHQADLEVARISQRMEVAHYQKVIQTAFREVADALLGVSSFTQQTAQQTALATAQQRRYELATARYRQGDDTYLNSLLAQQDWFSAQQGLLEAQFNKLASQIALFKALGGGWR